MKYYFSLSMSIDEFYPYYQGRISAFVVYTDEGLKLQFPAMHLRKFLTTKGIHGRYCLVSENNKFISLSKVSD